MADLTYEIVETIGVLGESANGWKKELNLVSWNGRDPVYDLRTWNGTHERMGKGITLAPDEIKMLKEILNSTNI